MTTPSSTLDALERCFDGAIPAVLATASADGVPNVTYISKAHRVDAERIAVSNQFMSKTARNLAANPRAGLLLVDPTTWDEYRLDLVYERTERRGHVFDRLRHDVDAVAEMAGMQDVFRLRAATIFRVVDVVQHVPHPTGTSPAEAAEHRQPGAQVLALGELAARLGRCGDLDVLVDTALEGLDQLLGYRQVHLLLVDEDGRRLYTIASRGFDAESVGAEVVVGDGSIGVAASRCETVRIASFGQMAKYSRAIVREYEERGGVRPGRELPMPEGADSRLAVPMMAVGQLVGVLVVDSPTVSAFGLEDERIVGAVATMLGSAVAHLATLERDEDLAPAPAPARAPARTAIAAAAAAPAQPAVVLRFFSVDGSTFLDGEYLIKGVAGRILWALLRQYDADARRDFTNRELRLDPSLQLPGFKDNLESRLILLKRRLDERGAPIRIERTGRGRFRLDVDAPLRLEDA